MRPFVYFLAMTTAVGGAWADEVPSGFSRLGEVAPDIRQDMRYIGPHNFVGRPIAGYLAGECILTRPAAEALATVAGQLAPSGLGLKVYDCYRPATAVADFVIWSRDISDTAMMAAFYPRVEKSTLFEKGYIAERSGHSRGSTVDLALFPLAETPVTEWQPGDPLKDCALPVGERSSDESLDFGTSYDCFDEKSHHGANGISEGATANRAFLRSLMERHGFKAYEEEWWHYTLVDEPFPETYFDFPVTSAP